MFYGWRFKTVQTVTRRAADSYVCFRMVSVIVHLNISMPFPTDFYLFNDFVLRRVPDLS